MHDHAKSFGALIALLSAPACQSITPAKPIIVANKCLSFQANPNVSTVVLGTYEGDRTLDSSAKGSSPPSGAASRQPRLIKVHSKATDTDLVLVLTSYDPVTWDLSDIPKARVRAVIAYGYNTAEVRGLAPNTPLRISSARSPLPACGKPIVAYQGGATLDKLVNQVTGLTGLKVSKFIGGYTHRDFDIDVSHEVAVAQTLKNDGNPTKDPPRHLPADWPGEAIVQNFVLRGSLRAATQADVDQWNAAATKLLATRELAPFVAEFLHVDDTYVALKPLVLPSAMSGAATRVFIVPVGVPKPQFANGAISDNSFYTIDDGRCSGPMPNC